MSLLRGILPKALDIIVGNKIDINGEEYARKYFEGFDILFYFC